VDDKTRLAFETVATGEVQALIKHLADGVTPNAVNDQGLSLLILAAATGKARQVETLLAKGANPNAADPRGLTPLMYAAAKGHEDIVRRLLAKEASPDRASLRGLTALMFAASEGHSLALRALLEGGANEGRIDEDGRSALLYAAYGGHTACVRRLLAHGADPTLRDKKGKTALDAAVELGFREVEALLRGSWTATHAPAHAPAHSAPEAAAGFESLKSMFNGDATLFALASLEKSVAEAWKTMRGGEATAGPSDPRLAANDLFGRQAADTLGGIASTAPPPPVTSPDSAAKPAAPAAKPAPIDAEDLVGQKPAKAALAQVIAVARLNKERAARGLPELGMTLHASFEGGRGTGKTTFARYYAQEIRKLGLLSKGHVTEVTRADLVSEYKGQTPAKTKAVVDGARGGVLLIDEAYTLETDDEDSAGQECLDTLTRMLDGGKDDMAVIFAGHAREMRDFMQRHPALKARVHHVISFADFSDEELGVILERMAAASRIRLTTEARREALRRIALQRKGKSFGNAREAHQVLASALAQQSTRLAQKDLAKLTEDELCTLIYSDFTEDPTDEGDGLGEAASTPRPKGALDRLQDLIGLEAVKREIQSLADYLRVQKARLGAGSHGDLTTHMIFAGNPGTGKTTVARLLGDLFREIGLLASGHLVETDRSGLVGGYVGQTALKTKERIDQAIGGVLFVDEAYALYRGTGQDDSFGREAIDTLLKAMEDLRGSFVVVLAGYTGEMETFLSSNPGLKSRFSKLIVFDDYTEAELEKIAQSMLEAQKFEITAAAMRKLVSLVEERRKTERHFANAREVRNLLEAAYKKQASRIIRLGNPEKLGKDVVNTIQEEDVG
jgi:SpoVK/Ycf46/Vps4 family AAA+-type ATPase